MESFNKLGSISMINKKKKKKKLKEKLQFILDIYSGNGSAKGKKALISKLHLSMLIYRPET
jgi:hypothetical protein